jgi:hypothetical protein
MARSRVRRSALLAVLASGLVVAASGGLVLPARAGEGWHRGGPKPSVTTDRTAGHRGKIKHQARPRRGVWASGVRGSGYSGNLGGSRHRKGANAPKPGEGGKARVTVVKPQKTAEQRARHTREATEAAAAVDRFGVSKTSLPKSAVKVKSGKDEFWYCGGYWFWEGGGRYTSMVPPRGAVAPNLPVGEQWVTAGEKRYRYFNGTFYDQRADDEFVVIDPPVGAAVARLPDEAQKETVGDETYFVFDGGHYQRVHRGTQVLYQVVEAPSQ